jgi:hypothetical protein
VILLLLSCIHTPPHEPVPGSPQLRLSEQSFMDPDGRYCSWASEDLWFEVTALSVVEPPDAPNGCRPPGEYSHFVELSGQDGPYVSAVVSEWGCCPEQKSLRCVTWDVRTGQEVSQDVYDEKNALRRQIRAQKIWERMGSPEGYTLDPKSFLVGGSHLTFCAIRGEDLLRIEVR